jgi:hypothetical protein
MILSKETRVLAQYNESDWIPKEWSLAWGSVSPDWA